MAQIRPGGHKKRRLDLHRADPEPCFQPEGLETGLAILLLRKWSLGEISAPTLQEIAKAAIDAGVTSNDVYKLARLGGSGHSPQNVQRDLQVLHFKNLASPEPFLVKTKVKCKDESGQPQLKAHSLPVLLPHEWVHSIDKKEMHHILGQEAAALFWQGIDLKRPRFQACPDWRKSYKNLKRDAPIPFLLHGDSAPHSEVDSLMCISMRALTSELSVAESQLLLFASPKGCLERQTVAAVMKTLTWSFQALDKNTFPSKDPWGNPLQEKERRNMAGQPILPNKKRCMLFGLIGDLEWYGDEFGMPRAMADMPCGYCQADQHDERPFNDFRATALWRDTIYTPQEMEEKYTHQLFKVPGLHPLGMYLDTLHTLDLGVSCHICGNILWEILEDHMEEPSREGRLASLNKMVVEEYNALGTPASQRVGILKVSNIGESSSVYPLLKHIKGRRVRYLVPVVKKLAEKYRAADGSHGQHRAIVAGKLAEIYDLLDIPNFHMTPTQLQQFRTSVEKLLLHYGWCAKNAFRNGLLRYSIVQKTHKLAHLPEMAKDVSPRCTQCYGAESFMGLMVGIAKRCTAGTAPHKAGSTITMKYRMSMHLLLQGLMVLDKDNENT